MVCVSGTLVSDVRSGKSSLLYIHTTTKTRDASHFHVVSPHPRGGAPHSVVVVVVVARLGTCRRGYVGRLW